MKSMPIWILMMLNSLLYSIFRFVTTFVWCLGSYSNLLLQVFLTLINKPVKMKSLKKNIFPIVIKTYTDEVKNHQFWSSIATFDMTNTSSCYILVVIGKNNKWVWFQFLRLTTSTEFLVRVGVDRLHCGGR